MKSFKHALVIGEKTIFNELNEIISMAAKANALTGKMIAEGQTPKFLNEYRQGIKLLEKQSDDVAFRVSEDITTGAVSPNIIDNLLAAVHVADDIVDVYYYLSRELSRMSKAKFPYFEALDETQSASFFNNMQSLADASLLKVKDILFASDLNEIIKLRKDIEALEEQGDDIKDEGLDWLYHEAPGMHYLQFYHYGELLHKFDDILDACEDLSDLILSIITSILK